MASGTVWVMPRNEPANISVAPNSPSARPQASASPATRPGPAPGSRRAGTSAPRRAERPRGVEPGAVERLERGLRLAQVERRGDERQRDDHAGGGQHELDPASSTSAAEHAVGPERGEQADARDRRRQDQRQLDQRDDQRPPAEAPRGEQVRGGGADDDDERDRDARCTQAQPQRVQRPLLPQARDEVERGRVDEDRHHRQGQEQQRRVSAATSATPNQPDRRPLIASAAAGSRRRAAPACRRRRAGRR